MSKPKKTALDIQIENLEALIRVLQRTPNKPRDDYQTTLSPKDL